MENEINEVRMIYVYLYILTQFNFHTLPKEERDKITEELYEKYIIPLGLEGEVVKWNIPLQED